MAADKSLTYRKVDLLLSSNAGEEVQEGDRLLLETGRMPRDGELALVRRGKAEIVCRWAAGRRGDVVGVVIGVKRKL